MDKIETVILGTEKKEITLDYRIPKTIKGPIVVYCHGFKGFKDWGGMDLVADAFCKNGMPFVKFNFSHNGTSKKNLTEFVDKDAFRNNTISDEMNDLYIVFNWIKKEFTKILKQQLPIALIGHSKGGTESIIFAARRKGRVSKLITWGATSRADIPWHNWDTDTIFEWRKTGVAKIENSRTGQTMELGLQLLEDFENHKANYNVISAASKLDIPWLICHGTDDLAVPFKNATDLLEASKTAKLLEIKKTGHTFGRVHPWTEKTLPAPSKKLVRDCISFLLKK